MLPRVLTALIGLPVLVSAIWFGSLSLTALVLVAAALGVREFYRLTPPGVGTLSTGLGVIWVAAMVLGAQAASSPVNFLEISAVIWLIGAFVAILWLIALYAGSRYLTAGIYTLAGPVYVGFLLSHALVLREAGGTPDSGRLWLLLALLVTFATDTGAFFVGRTVGRHRMAPKISPAKTWEGAAGGFAAATGAAIALGLLLDLGIVLWQVAVIGATVGVVSQLGDLLESALKRLSNVKDAGSIIPGHGGILDRLDSMVISLPAVYYLVATVFAP